MTDTQYYYAVARIRSKELSLLSSSFLEQLLGAKTLDEALRLLHDKGWSTNSSVEGMLQDEKKKTWDLMAELVGDVSVFNVLLLNYDYHNLKAAVKEALTSDSHKNIYSKEGTIDADIIAKAVASRDFTLLPESMRSIAEEALTTLLHTHDGQLTDIMIDRAALEAIHDEGKKSGSGILSLYGELTVVAADIKTASRSAKTGKDIQFLRKALAPCDSLDTELLAQAAVNGTDAICDYLSTTKYADAVPELRSSPSAFERWCDNLIIRNIRPELYHPFTIGPLAAYIIARENEIKTVRIVLSGKINDLPEISVRERVREMYV